ncbi:ornithine cyclodeaminase [Virgibacillus pantothenticus]|uniref:ornithine cyclodeaminase family protein n=1 Tax=Virgibacillus TaxID=84406 RepID=UPI00090AEE99|nr:MULTISPECIES: NAD(P)-binding domain-containing protein [Virgibacillus]API91163.1 ornithine cyclodeaminase [Virgibacillus sp. 6R]MBS7429154.1 NAD(P)-binding domain-containing protein [Virgibacillus sp. 19R1-5]MBU8566818.1 NAD(P)-binding domain-containing protein [Virgibacillus pantothenticus]MBU8600489.1 NAD(P)-binding domain-containing protein [Virgibacillus pantothenticus]MBU8635116.1 NAD(P)-binding domain-containing protein [Virgibacillus pantothenticus]
MLILSEKEIQTHYFMQDAIRDLKQGLQAKNNGMIENPSRIVIEIPKYNASGLYMPSADLSLEIASVKVVSIFPENPKQQKPTTQGVLLLTDATNGEHICLMTASFLTRLRTGALSGIATEKMARLDAKTLGVIGTGSMAFEQVLGVLAVRDIKDIILFNRTFERAVYFKEKLQAWGVTIPIQVVQDVQDVMQSADIVACSTRSNTPVFNGKDVQPGTHINGVGSFLPTMREVDVETITKADQIVVDDLASAKEEAGELIYAAEQSDWSFSNVAAQLNELIEYPNLIRPSDEAITFFKSVGTAYFDLAVARGIYAKAISLGFGQKMH